MPLTIASACVDAMHCCVDEEYARSTRSIYDWLDPHHILLAAHTYCLQTVGTPGYAYGRVLVALEVNKNKTVL